MRWDDIELLRLIDELEGSEVGSLATGLTLMRRMAEGKVLDPCQDYAPFARELVLAHGAGYLGFDDRVGYGMPLADPAGDPNSWLQQIRDIRLTLAGRDRARGRVVLQPPPDPGQDDGRQIAGMTLEDIARAVGDAYTASQLPRFLLDSGVPKELLPPQVPGSKWAYVLDVLEHLHDGGSATRRALREFIGRWLGNRLHTWPRDDVRARIVGQLAQQGWHVREDCLVIGEPQAVDPQEVAPSNRGARIAALHASVRQVADRYLESGHVEVAIFEAFKAVHNRVKQMTGLESDGSDLMAKAFRDKDPPVRLADLSTETGRNIQAGFRFMFMGAVRGIRNPDAHELFQALDEEEALEKLGFASMLMRRLDEASPDRA